MARRWLISGLLVAAAFAQIHAATAQTNSPPFPRLGAYLIGGTLDFVNLSHIGSLQVAVFSDYPGYSAGGKTLAQQVTAVKALNPNMKITAYEDTDAVYTSGGIWAPKYNAIAANHWFLRTTWPSGTILTASGEDLTDVMSPTLTTTSDAYAPSGSTYRRWVAGWNVSFSTAVASNLDGIYTDNDYYMPRESADFLQNGTTQTASSAAQNWRNAYADYDTQLRAAMGSSYMHWGNLADWPDGSIQGYNQLLNGGVLESAIGQSYSLETTSWARLMTGYAVVMNALAPFQGGGPYLIFQQDGSITDYQGMRYGLASCLLDNGYYHFNTAGQGGGNNVAWFDEMGVSLGAPTAGPNNPANGTYSNGGLTVWKQGVYRRDFANGIALVNPKGNGPQTVTLETTYKHFSGTQDPSVNNGQSVTSVTLNDRDGVILLRTTQQPVPDPPTLSVQ